MKKGKEISILLVEDNPGDVRLVEEMLKDSVSLSSKLQHVSSLDEAKRLKRKTFDVLLLDLHYDHVTGIETYHMARSMFPDLPIVVLTGLSDERLALNVVQEGAQDYLLKDAVDARMLSRSIIYAIERKKAEEAQIRSEKQFRTLADNIPNLVWMANKEGKIYWFNSRWYEYTGTTPNKMDTDGWKSVHDPSQYSVILKKWNESLKTGKEFDMVFPLKGADGKFRPFLTRIVPIRDESGEIVQWFGTNTDITRIKELERQKDEFLGIASHELKTPVTSLKAFGQVLQNRFKKSGDMSSALLLQKMDAQINKLTTLIQDLLDVTKIESGKLQFHMEYFNIDECLQETVEEVQRTTDKHIITIHGSSGKKIWGDKERVGQVVTNFLTNAIKYSPHEKNINVSLSSEKDTISVSVKDYGIGIPKKDLESVFDRFFRVSAPTHSTVPGIGLGLYISSEIIKRQGGEISVSSKIREGSTFTFTLPIKKRPILQQHNSLVLDELKHE